MNITALLYAVPPTRYVGGELSTLRHLKHAQQAGHTITILSITDGEQRKYDGMNVIPAPQYHNLKITTDIFITHADIEYYARQLTKGRPPGRTILFIHNTKRITVTAARTSKYDNIIVTSHTALNKIEKNLKVPATVIYPPTPARPVTFKTARQFVYMVNTSPEKGGHIINHIEEQTPDIPYLIQAGGHGEQNKTTAPNIFNVGNGDNLLIWKLASMFIAPSQDETYGMAVAEAIMEQIPVIASDIPAHREVAGDAALYIPVDAEPAEWLQAVRNIYLDAKQYDEWSVKSYEQSTVIAARTEQSYELFNNLLEGNVT